MRMKVTKILKEDDSFRKIYEIQAVLQERVGRLARARVMNRRDKALMIKEEMFDVNKELGEMLEHLPFKYWKKYPITEVEDWRDDKQREDCLEEYVDALHFFTNIGLILGFSPEEVVDKYFYKNKINHKRQDENYSGVTK